MAPERGQSGGKMERQLHDYIDNKFICIPSTDLNYLADFYLGIFCWREINVCINHIET